MWFMCCRLDGWPSVAARAVFVERATIAIHEKECEHER